MEQFIYPNQEDWKALLSRPTASYEELESLVSEVFLQVQKHGDKAVAAYTRQFDQTTLANSTVSSSEIEAASTRVGEELKQSIQLAKTNIECFHKAQETPSVSVETQSGVNCWQEKRAIQKVGLYIPGGSAPLFSTILMLAIPAQIAGCKEIVLCSPPNKEGNLPDVVLYTAQLCGVTKIFKVGGIQAIAAMTFGTETIPAVYKLFGPGNQYVTVAKQWATRYNMAIDMPAGPSELLVVADASADPIYVAADLLSQAEHGPDSQVILVTTDVAILAAVQSQIEAQLALLPRKEIAQKAIANSKMIAFSSDELAIDFINQYGPEHYIICMENEDLYVNAIENAGSVFVGESAPVALGDYTIGTNHVLPTDQSARFSSGLSVDDFIKKTVFIKMGNKTFKKIAQPTIDLARQEGLEAHALSVEIRKIKT